MTTWNPELIERAKRLFDERLPYDEIARRTGTSRGAIKGLVKRQGWKRVRPYPAIYWTPERLQEAQLMYEGGAGAQAVAERFETTTQAIWGLAFRNGWRRPPRKAPARPRKPKMPNFVRCIASGPQRGTKLKNEPIPEGNVATPLTSGCRWIYGVPGAVSHWCGKARVPLTWWCAEHLARVYVVSEVAA